MAAHRARMISAGSSITVEPRQRQEPRCCAARDRRRRHLPEDLREDLIHSMQKYVEVDEPEKHAAPLLDANADPRTATPSTP